MKIAVIGAGYVGMATAILMLQNKQNQVDLIEKDQKRRENLNDKFEPILPIVEEGMEEAYHKAFMEDRVKVLNTIGSDPYDFIFVCVGTPACESGEGLDMNPLMNALNSIENQDCPVIIKSTLNVGETRYLSGEYMDLNLVFSPEFLREGTALKDSKNPDRIIIGTDDQATYEKILNLYKSILTKSALKKCKFIQMSSTAAEIVKLASNSYLALRLTFFNELSMLCESQGAEIKDVVAGITADPRIGNKYAEPSIGYAGPCLPKDIRSLINTGAVMNTLKAAVQSNAYLLDYYTATIQGIIHGSEFKNILFLGIAFKSYSDDIRSSRTAELKNKLKVDGSITVYDPRAGFNAEIEGKSFDLVILSSEEYVNMLEKINYKKVFDLKSILPKDADALYVGRV